MPINNLKQPHNTLVADKHLHAQTGSGFLRSLVVCGAFLMLLFLPNAAFSAKEITVIFPEVASPYKGIFDTILQGIKSQEGNKVQLYPLIKDHELEGLKRDLQQQRTEGIIALGRRGYLAVNMLQTELPTVVGALSLVPNGVSGISLSADPELLFARLKSLVPESKRVFVVYSAQTSGWLIPLAERAASKYRLELMAYPAADLREAMLHYRSLLQETQGKKDAIWLPLDNISANNDVVLPMLLQKAWDKDLVIFSNKPSHVQRGALFSMYPNNFGLGQELSKLLNQQLEQQGDPQVKPLDRLRLAVNLRTAAHLGLNFSPRQQEEFALTFPSR
ncbi:MAG: ABC transporter substrate-binding protein [Desulfuromonadaceae bacterium]|nr:ABC transporter substrate-binding protein [Desulfuromonadaceae bacterium]